MLLRTVSALALLAGLALPSHAAGPNAGPGAVERAKSDVGAAAGVFSTRARLAVYYSPSFGGVIHGKNVTAVTTPSVGIHCITPAIALNLKGIFPQVTVDWNLSSGFALLAYTKDTSAFSDCPSGDLEVTTYTFDSSGPVLSNLVAFNFVLE